MIHQPLREKLASVVRTWALDGIVCTPGQWQACEAAFVRLLEESWDEQALAILHALLPLAHNREDPWGWLTTELLFEAYAIALDDRSEAAGHYLRFGTTPIDDALDRYNERMGRFAAWSLQATIRLPGRDACLQNFTSDQ